MSKKNTKSGKGTKVAKTAKGKGKPEAAPAPATVAAAGKPARKAKREPKAKRVSCLDAAAKLLASAGTPMGCKDMIEQMAAKGLWSSPKGKTPDATLYAAIIREIAAKGKAARFTKTDRGLFAAATSEAK
jgi:hypothetical protein